MRQPDTKRGRKVIQRFYYARFDQHLALRHIDALNQSRHLLQPVVNVCDKQLVGAHVRHGAAARAEQTRRRSRRGTALLQQSRQNFSRLGVVQGKGTGLQRLDHLYSVARLQPGFFTRRQLSLRRHPNHVTGLLLPQAARLQNGVQHLVPGHILQTHGQLTADVVGHDDVDPAELGHQLQCGA